MTLARTPYARLSPADIGQVDRELKKLEQMSAGLYVPKVLVAARSPYTVQGTDTMLLCDCTAGAITLTFPLAARVEGMSVVVVKSDTSANAVTLSGTFSGVTNPTITVAHAGFTVVAMNGVYHVTALVTYPIVAGEATVASIVYPYGDIRRYGALLNGVLDCTIAAQAAAQTLIAFGGGPVRFPFGSTLITGALPTIGTLGGGVWIEGDDKGGSLITFNPTVANTVLFNFDSGGGGSLVWRSGVRNLKITSSNSVAKVGIRMLETRESFLEKVEINFPNNDGSEALQLYGRDDMTIRDVVVYAPIPLHIKKNPYVGQQVGLDHATFYGLTLYQVTGSGQPLITVDAGCHLSNVAFLGKTTLVGGNGWFLYDSTSDVAGGVFRLAFENIRWEHGGQTQTRPGCTIKPNGGNATRQGVSFRQGSVETVAGVGAGIGIQIRNVRSINLDDFSFNGASGLVGLDLDSSCDDLWYRDLVTPGGITHSITGLTQLMGAGFVTGGSPEQEKLGYWRASSHAAVDLYFGLGNDLFMPVSKQAIGAGVTVTLPVNSSSLGYAIVDVHTTKGTGSIERGQWRMNTDTADLSSDLDFGSANVVAAAGAVPLGKIVVYRSVGDDTIKIRNGLAESRTFVIRFRMVK